MKLILITSFLNILVLFFPETKASISCILMGTTHLSMSVVKKNKILAINEVRPIYPQQNEGLTCIFLETKTSISCIQMETTQLSMSITKRNSILAINEVCPVDSQQNKGLKCSFPETRASISCIGNYPFVYV